MLELMLILHDVDAAQQGLGIGFKTQQLLGPVAARQ
jgi:hypothetical protein